MPSLFSFCFVSCPCYWTNGCYTIPALSNKGKNAFLIFYPFKLQNLDNDRVIQVPEKKSQSVSVLCTLEFKAAVSLLAVEDSIIWLNEAL